MIPLGAEKDGTIDDEIAALVRTLRGAEERIAELTGGEVDSIRDADGRVFVLRHAEDQLRRSESIKQAAILDALPAHVALLDTQGRIVAVNAGWRRHAEANGIKSPDHGVGLNYLDITEVANAADHPEASVVARGLRAVLAGTAATFSIEYPCDTPTRTQWYILSASRLADDHPNGAIVLHVDITARKRAEDEIREYAAQLKTAVMSTVQVAMTISELRDPYTAGHERRVAQIAVAIAAELGFDARRQEGIQVAGFLHDLGKITIPSEILTKPTRLSIFEYQLIQGHVQAGFEVLNSVPWPWPVAQIVLQHHERMDGSGYPNALQGEAILPDARILAVADVVEAMASPRPYRAAMGIEAALEEIERGRGSSYDAKVADACLRLFRHKKFSMPH